MAYEISILSGLSMLGGVQALFIGIFLLTMKKGNKQVNIFMALLLIGQFLLIYDYFILNNKLYYDIPHLVLFSFVFQLANAPLYYLLIKSYVSPNFKMRKLDTLHFTPAFSHTMYGVISFHILPTDQKVSYIEFMLSGLRAENFFIKAPYIIFNLIIAMQIAVYLYLSFKIIKSAKSTSKKRDAKRVKSLKKFNYMLLGIIGVLLLSSLNIAQVITSFFQNIDLGSVLLLFYSIYMFYVAYFIITHQEIFRAPIEKYQKSTLNDYAKNRILEKLKELMNNEKPYRNAQLTIDELSQQLSVPTRQLSQVINEHYSQNFYEFLNTYRVDFAKSILKDESFGHLSVFGIALESGFNSKSSFYTAFKKVTGVTPSFFRKNFEG